MAHLAYKFRLSPTATQERELRSQLETLRHVYNDSLAWWKDAYEAEKAGEKVIPRKAKKSGDGETKLGLLATLYPVFSNLRNLQVADMKGGGEGPHWLTKVGAVAVRDTIKRVQVAFDNFFRRVKQGAAKAGFPRFKSYGRLRSIPFDNYASGCTLRSSTGTAIRSNAVESRRGYRLDVFGVGRIKVNVHRRIAGVIKTACVERDVDGKWYVILVAQLPDVVPVPNEGPAVGIDVGLEHFLTDSNGTHRPNPRHLKHNLKELRRLQRSASRKVLVAKAKKRKFRECKNLQKSQHKVARLHVRVKNLRKEHHHQEANRLVRENGTICVEKLSIQGMLKNGKLARSIQDAGWSGFLNVLQCKAVRAGVQFVEVDARGTSQTCPECEGEVRKNLSVRIHNCPHCGYVAQRDHASARVILQRGIGINPAGQVGAGLNLDVSRDVPRSPVGARDCFRPREGTPEVVPKAPVKAPRSQSKPQVTLWDVDAA